MENQTSSDEESYGPALPPSMTKERGSAQKSSKDAHDSSSEDDSYGPVLPPSMKKHKDKSHGKPSRDSHDSADDPYGPSLPPGMQSEPKPAKSSVSEDSPSAAAASCRPVIGPSLPPSLSSATPAAEDAGSSSSDEDAYGPALPPGFVRRPSAPAAERVRGPRLPPGGLPPAPAEEDGEDEDLIGPRPPAEDADLGRYAAAELERRAHSMKEKLDAQGRPVKLVREDWMLELPPDRAKEFGLGPRQFRRTNAPERGDTSGWTEVQGGDGPRKPTTTTAKKADSKDSELVELATKQRDERMAEVAETLQNSRKQSLLDMHQKEVKRKKKEAGDAPKRRQEFDRDRDLGSNRFDDAQRAAAIKRSRGAADMFSAGAQKFL